MEKQIILLQKTIETLHSQDQWMSDKDRKDFTLIFRTISTVNDLWNSHRILIQKINVETITPDMVRIEVNECPPVTYITCKPVPCHE
jgi:hypothetical protein